MAAKRKKPKPARRRSGGEKVKFLAVLPADAIKCLKLEAIERGTTERGTTASSVLEEAIAAWMKVHRSSTRKPLDKEAGEKPEKRQFLARMDAELIRDLKILAMDWRVTASTLAGRAVSEWLGQQKSTSSKK
jgi:hypothetical protein